nr:uncharacterized protein LOC106689667 isoform X2 [Halyomorpha halys]
MYRIIIGITYPSEKVNTYTLPHICNFLLCSYSVWRVNHATTSASNKSKEFNALLYKLMINDVTKDILQNDKLSLHILMKREVVFTACGFFNLDYTLVHSVDDRLSYNILSHLDPVWSAWKHFCQLRGSHD